VNTRTFAPPGTGIERTALRALSQSLGIPHDRKVVVYLGLLAPYQGTDLLLEAAAIMLNEWGRRDVHFLVMGFPGVDTYRAQADRLDLNGWVSFPGRIPYAEAPRFLAVGDVAVAPKLSATEGAGKIGNYMAMGLPTVAFDMPISHEYLGNLGVYARKGDSRSLAEKLCEVLDNPGHYEQVGAQLRQRCIATLSWDSAIHEIEAVYEQAIRRRMGKSARAERSGTVTPAGPNAKSLAVRGNGHEPDGNKTPHQYPALSRAGLEETYQADRPARDQQAVGDVAQAAAGQQGTVRP
jgi:glycosyltransferase involved in cell wall biosynthesis